MQAQTEKNSHFPASKSRKVCSVSCPGSRGFPSALLVNTTWPRILCGGAMSADCRDRLPFSLRFHVEVKALWAFVCVGSWVGVRFQSGTRYTVCTIKAVGWLVWQKSFLPILLLSAWCTPIYSFLCSSQSFRSFTLPSLVIITTGALSWWPTVHH